MVVYPGYGGWQGRSISGTTRGTGPGLPHPPRFTVFSLFLVNFPIFRIFTVFLVNFSHFPGCGTPWCHVGSSRVQSGPVVSCRVQSGPVGSSGAGCGDCGAGCGDSCGVSGGVWEKC